MPLTKLSRQVFGSVQEADRSRALADEWDGVDE
jgi:hypothetical protein